jgi:hypothetical protein
MTLREKFKPKVSINTEGEAGRYAEECEQIADDYAIEILESYHNSLFNIPLKEGEAKKIVEHIKKEL